MKNKILIIICLVGYLFLPIKVLAAESSFNLRPDSGEVINGEEFTVDVLIDSGGSELTLARSVLTYDPSKIEIKKVERNTDLFCTWADTQQTVDQENGVIMITGSCQSGAGDLYVTEGDSDVFVRLTFEVVDTGDIPIEFEWSGEDEEFKSVLMADGSPPQNVLNTQPDSASFTGIDSGDDDSGEEVPDTAILPWENKGFLIGVFALVISAIIVLASWFAVLTIRYKGSKNIRTVFYPGKD